jgi:hypothetical protein
MWERKGMQVGFQWRSQKEKKNLDICGRIKLKWTLDKKDGLV